MTKITLFLSDELYTQTKIMAVLTKRTMSQLIRISLIQKIKELKETSEDEKK
jgi:predicted transcriptional regulator